MAFGHLCNLKGLMLCVMLPNFNHSFKPALTLSTTLNYLSQDGASNQELNCRIILFHSHSLFLSPFLADRQTDIQTDRQTDRQTDTHTHTHTESDRDRHTDK